jgi:hypothetical protein
VDAIPGLVRPIRPSIYVVPWGQYQDAPAAEKRTSGDREGAGSMREAGNGIDLWRGSVLECVQRQLPLSPAPPRCGAAKRPVLSAAPGGRDSKRGRGTGTPWVREGPATKAAADAARTPGRYRDQGSFCSRIRSRTWSRRTPLLRFSAAIRLGVGNGRGEAEERRPEGRAEGAYR